MKISDILIKPHVTEKALTNAKTSVYVFEVAADANKNQIKNSVEKLFDVKVAEVATIMRKGKSRRIGRKMKTKLRPNKKIAYIKVASGKINVFPKE